MIEDDSELSQLLSEYLNQYNINVTPAEEPYIGLSMLTQKKFDLIILDLTLPGIDGLEVIPKIREHSNIPIIISSARNDITDKVIAMERGADDYMPKPYDPRELVTRIKTILRRTQGQQESTESSLFELNIKARNITFDNKLLELTAAEFDIRLRVVRVQNHLQSLKFL